MERRKFLSKSVVAGAVLPLAYASYAGTSAYASGTSAEKPAEPLALAENKDIIIEKPATGRPHEGKVLAVIQPHCDDVPLFAAGTVAKLVHEGYTAYMIRTSNDDVAGKGNSFGEVVLNNEIANDATAKVLGIKKVYELGYRNHRMDEYNIQEIKGRLIFLFRLLKVDTVISYDPWGHYEENPDHYVTAKAVEAARWMAGSNDYPEQLEVVGRHSVIERYYFARGPQLVNRIVDISNFIDQKVQSNVVIKSQGPGGDAGSLIMKSLAAKGKKLPIFGNDNETANASYVKNFVLDIDSQNLRGVPSDREIGKKYGLEWAEQFRYFGPNESHLTGYITKHAVSM